LEADTAETFFKHLGTLEKGQETPNNLLTASIIRPTTMAPWILSVMNEIRKPPRALKILVGLIRALSPVLTRVDSRDGAFHNDSSQSTEACQGFDDLLKSRELRHHVEKNSDKPSIPKSRVVEEERLNSPYVRRLKYRAVTTPYLCLVHSVKTKPSGHCLLIIGPRKPNARSGSEEDSA